MKCPRCQADNRDGARFCRECGATFAAVCSSCGAKVEAGSKFCDSCGSPLAAAPTATTATSRFASPESYTPKRLAERIVTSKAVLEGERKQVTVLFADLKGSMELLADRDPEEARKILDPVLELMMEAVHRYEGTVNQVLGDGIMALFGAPLALEDHAVRACYAALRLQEAVKRYSEEVRRTIGLPVHVRIGMNSGEVVVRSIGNDLRMDYTAVGQTTHLAARMEQAASPDSILISAETLKHAEGNVQVKPLGPIRVKGLLEPIEAFEVIGVAHARTRLQAAAMRGLTQFVGRDAELEQLLRAFSLAGQGHGQVAAVVGEPGVGKSRLFWEFTHSHRTHGWLVVESGSVSYGKATPYLPLIELFKAYFQIGERDDARRIREKVSGKLVTLDPALLPMLSTFLTLLDVPIDDPAWQTLDPLQRRQRILDDSKRLIFRESQVQPVLLVFEDLHWIDSETQRFLNSLVDSVPASRVLLLVNYRPEYEHSWGRKTYYTQARLDSLPPASARELLRVLLGEHPSVEPLKPLLIERTEGNPLFMEESVRALADAKALAGERGAYRLVVQHAATVPLPATVQAILSARIDRLPPEDKALLQTAAVVGKDVPFGLLQTVTGLAEDELARALARLQSAEFLYEASLFPDLEYTFKHAITHEAAYVGLLQDRRRELHARIVEAIEIRHHDRLDERIEQLAHHAVRGELWDKAVEYLPQAAAKAADRGANREAATYLEQALDVLRRLPERRATIEQAIDLRLELRNVYIALFDLARSLECVREAEPLARALDDRRRLSQVLTHKTHSTWMLREHAQAIASGEEAVALATANDDVSQIVAATQYLGQVYVSVGDLHGAIALFRRNIAALEGARAYERLGMHSLPAVLARVFLANALSFTGDFDEGARRAREALQIAETAGHPFSIVGAYVAATWVHGRRGDLDQAIPAAERGLALSRTWSIGPWFSVLMAELARAYALAGRLADALAVLEEATAAQILTQARGFVLRDFAHAYLLTGHVDLAVTLADRALEPIRRRGEHAYTALGLHVLGEISSSPARLDPDRAAGCYREGLELAQELGMRPLVAHCHDGLAKLYRRIGKQQDAEEHFRTAMAMFRTLGMTHWLEKAEAEMGKPTEF